MGTNTTNQMLNASQKRRKNMLEMIEKVIRDGGNLHIEPAVYGGDIFVCIDFPCRWGLNNATELSDAQQKTILLSFAAERKKYLENVVQY